MYMYHIDRSVNSITRNTRVNKQCFVISLLAMISLHMLTFRLMVTMIADYSLLLEIMISSISQYEMMYIHIQFYGYWLCFFKKMKNVKSTF